MSDVDQFTIIIEQLLAGRFVCEFSDKTSHEYLSKETYRQDVDTYLRKIGRRLKATEDRSTYYCAYSSIHANDRRADVRRQFRETINTLEPLCRWLKLVMSALQREASLQPGDIVRQGELLRELEVSQALIDDLSIITRSGLFATKKDAAKDQLNHILNVLVEQGYLVRHSPTSSVYTATGKWGYLYEVLDFVHTHETIGDDEDAREQRELSL